MKVSSNVKNPAFGAKLLSQWRCNSSVDNSARNITIVKLENHEYPLAEKFVNTVDKTLEGSITNDIFIDALKAIKKLLESGEKVLKKTRVLLALYNDKLCGILVANIPKKDKTGNLVYSSRHNCAKNETELDWLATWSPNKDEKIKGIGKAILGEYYKTLENDNFKDVYVRSELPENSFAQYFYESMGFNIIAPRRQLWCAKNANKAMIKDECEGLEYDKIIPMLAEKTNIKEIYDKISKSMCRQEFVDKSVNIKELIKI